MLDLVARKRTAGEDVVELAAESGEGPTDEVDRMQVLKASLAQADEEEDEVPAAKRKPGGQSATQPRPSDFEGRTKDELYELAQALDVEGRSAMTKQELVDAIRAAS